MTNFGKVGHFMKTFGQEIKIKPDLSTEKINKLRVSLINEELEEFKEKYKNERNVPRPSYWSGWCLKPSSIEFWLHKDNRIHERHRYKKTTSGWEKEILYP